LCAKARSLLGFFADAGPALNGRQGCLRASTLMRWCGTHPLAQWMLVAHENQGTGYALPNCALLDERTGESLDI
jgi:hypothetical protein